MRRPRSSTLAAVGAMVVCAWCAGWAFFHPEAGTAAPSAEPRPAQASTRRAPAEASTAHAQSAGLYLAPGPSAVAHVQVSLPSARSGGTVGASVSRPEASRDVRGAPGAPDASLPASGVHCTVEDGVPRCGECRTDSECPAQHGCVINRGTRRFECLASECEEDAHCLPGSLCRAVNDGASGPRVRRCVAEGLRAEGERCLTVPVGPEDTCREGLLCVQQLCGRPCEKGVEGSCPTGERCVDTLNGPGCYPDCRASGCAQGETCTRLRDETYQCLEAVTGSCHETPCAGGERCNLRMAQGRAAFWCAPRCNPLEANACPGGGVCGRGGPTDSTCFQRCEPRAADTCGPGWRCTSVSEDLTQWGCVPVP